MVFNGGGAEGMGHFKSGSGTIAPGKQWRSHCLSHPVAAPHFGNLKHRTTGTPCIILHANTAGQRQASFQHRHKCLSEIFPSTVLLSKPRSESHTTQTDLKLVIFLLGVLGL